MLKSLMQHLKTHAAKLLFIPPIVAACLLFQYMLASRQQPVEKAMVEQARSLHVINVPVVDVIPRVEAYGISAAARMWRAISEVKGRITYTHAELRAGGFVNQGDVLLRVDDQEYVLAIQQLDASIRQIDVNILEVQQAEKNNRSSLAFEEETLTISIDELKRLQLLAAQRAGSQADIDAQRRAVVAQQQRVNDLKNQIALSPVQVQSLLANKALYEAQRKQALLDQSRTTIVAPFRLRFGEVSLHKDQVVSAGELLFEAFDVQLAEVEAHLLPRQASQLIKPRDERVEFDPSINPMDVMREIFKVRATVSLPDALGAVWEARFLRILDQVDKQTHTVGVVFGVDEPYANAIPAKRPPLMPGTFCKITIDGVVRPRRVVIPRNILRDGQVSIVDAENRLRNIAVIVELVQDEYCVISSGLQGGERLIVADPTPAIEGMLVAPVDDGETEARLHAAVAAERAQ